MHNPLLGCDAVQLGTCCMHLHGTRSATAL